MLVLLGYRIPKEYKRGAKMKKVCQNFGCNKNREEQTMTVTGLMFEEDKQHPGLTHCRIDSWTILNMQNKGKLAVRKAQQVIRNLEGSYVSIGEVK